MLDGMSAEDNCDTDLCFQLILLQNSVFAIIIGQVIFKQDDLVSLARY